MMSDNINQKVSLKDMNFNFKTKKINYFSEIDKI